MSLASYNKKRNFKKTPEPSGKEANTKTGLAFVVQRHKASHLHYDFRIEMNGVLKSWAVPKGPSMNPNDKRLAMMVEDHPYGYKNFAGVIPEGNYGAGIVEIWDKGFVTDIENDGKKDSEKKLLKGLHAGSLKFILKGKKLKGEFALVKMKGKQVNAWLLLKHKDKYAVEGDYSSEEYTPKNSPINKWLNKNAAKPKEKDIPAKKKAQRKLPGQSRKLRDFIKPMLAKETDKPFNDKNWLYEIKWDGYRAIAEVKKKNVLIYSRNGNTFDASYPILANELKNLNITAILDGEIIAVDKEGRSDFQLLQYYQSDSQVRLEYRVFDVLSINGKNTCALPLIERKKLLKQLLSKKNNHIKYSEHIPENGVEFFKASLKKNLEGIMAKKSDSGYYPGLRTGDWLKIKHHKTQEAIIAGFTQPTGSRKHFGALVLAMYNGNELKYTGHTGSGFNTEMLESMSKKLKARIRKKTPFQEKVETNMPVTWVKPDMVCEIKYTEWTRDGKMRHPIFLRLRPDKKAKDVKYEN